MILFNYMSPERKEEARQFMKNAAIGWFSRCDFWNEACKYAEEEGFAPESFEYYEAIYKICMVWDMDRDILGYMCYQDDNTKRNLAPDNHGSPRCVCGDRGREKGTDIPQAIEAPYDGSLVRRKYWKKVTER